MAENTIEITLTFPDSSYGKINKRNIFLVCKLESSEFSAPVVQSNISSEVSLGFLNSLANSRTQNVGDGNYIFHFNDDEIKIDDETKEKKLVEVLPNDEGDLGKYFIECREIKAFAFPGWKNDIILKNATERTLKIDVKYKARDFMEEKDVK